MAAVSPRWAKGLPRQRVRCTSVRVYLTLYPRHASPPPYTKGDAIYVR